MHDVDFYVPDMGLNARGLSGMTGRMKHVT